MKSLNKNYLLDTSFAEFVKNHLSEFHPKFLLSHNLAGTINDIIISATEVGETEYLSIIDPLLVKPQKSMPPEQYNTHHFAAMEKANEAMLLKLKELIIEYEIN